MNQTVNPAQMRSPVPADPFPLSTWLTPEVQSLGRLPMTSALPPRSDLIDARTDAPSPWVVSLDGDWRFRLVEAPDDVTPAMIAESVSRWDTMPVPSSWVFAPGQQDERHGAPIYLNIRMPWQLHAPDVPADNPTGLFRRTFTVDPSWTGRRTFLRVGSADSLAWVWVNGRFIGLGKDSRLASTFEVTDALVDGPNDLCIGVPRWSDSSWIEDQDQWWMPGLHRSVELVSEPVERIADAALVPGLAPDGTTGTLAIDITADMSIDTKGATVEVVVEQGRRRSRPPPADPCACVRVRRPDGRGDQRVPAGQGHRVTADIEVPGIEAWTHETPVLYRATVILRDRAGAVLDVRSRRVGFRRVEIIGDELLINGVAGCDQRGQPPRDPSRPRAGRSRSTTPAATSS